MTKSLNTLMNVEDYKTLVDRYDVFLFDCDGVIWLGSKVIPGAKETIEYLKSQGKKLIFVTNNSSVSRAKYAEKFQKFNIKVEEQDIFSSAYATAVYLKDVISFDMSKYVYPIGGSGITDELRAMGVKVLEPHFPTIKNVDDVQGIVPDPSVGAVVVGLDVEINYSKLAFAHINITKSNALFIATNDDSTLPVQGLTFPGAGSLLSVLINSTSESPVVMGKPNQIMFDCISKANNLDLSRTLMIGDRLDTDIEFGTRAGVDTLLVFTGVTDRELAASSPISFTHSIQSLGDISKLAQ
ncbi:4-nitrophenylphosphatase [Smittium mucronatum]|uniref:4-nitrophenylphosphatase n=1 Tax=Smittium mucronatum TaxID=133383 RepID=A0A1R0GQG3_9FUNG|nr:4-nitrophenylphosphatase [Smittium mucronatum]OLY79275.1 4-nitrophenylphosphatase [Smittium mucronatum]